MSDTTATTGGAHVSERLLTPDNHVLMLIDHESQMGFAVSSHPMEIVLNATEGLAKTARLFDVPTVVTTVMERHFSGPVFQGVRQVFPDDGSWIDRTTMNPWEDERVRERVRSAGLRKLVLAGQWTEVCVTMPALCALEEGFEVYVVCDASGGVSSEAHERSVQRMVQAGAQPLTWLQYLLELQRDWARSETSSAVGDIARAHAGAYGLGAEYIYTMLGWDREDRS
ncbi:hydrolase [Streptomyces iconiensis]|uniref:Hydrolase n=1 Tax=Streptomyces iconiensis TaxID=1384038 RepID=A0ABT6ZUM8_9ACTN|nr:hydrolase [Streptomyces iconiensis]MDJ1132769.1 hydrolase [Streptomyces iconiensis]